MSVLDYSRTMLGAERMAAPYAIVSNCIGLGGNVWGAMAAWSVHAVPQGTTLHAFGLESFLFYQAMLTALIGVGFGLAALFKARGRVPLVLLAFLGMHMCLTPYLVSNVVLDYLVNRNGLTLGF